MLRSRAMLNGARDQACVHCGVRDGTVVAAHYQGMRSTLYGKGKSIKPSDLMIADLCGRCHSLFDSHEASSLSDRYLRKIDQSEKFLHCIMLTLERRIQQGILTAK